MQNKEFNSLIGIRESYQMPEINIILKIRKNAGKQERLGELKRITIL